MKDRTTVTIFRSNRSIEAQAIAAGKVIFGKKYTIKKDKNTPVLQCAQFGEDYGNELNKKKIKEIKFNRNGFRYHGRVSSFADGMRKAKVSF